MTSRTGEFLDFRVEFFPPTDGIFPVRASSVQGEAKGTFVMPFEASNANRLVRQYKKELGESSAARRDPHIGELLFEALVRDAIAALYFRTVSAAENRPDTGIRIRLQMDIDDPSLARLSALPWELLSNRSLREHLSLKSRSQVVRYLELGRATELGTFDRPFRILVAFSNPKGTFAIDDELIAQEASLFQDTLSSDPALVEVEILEQASLASIRAELSNKPFHAFHYLGHGSFMRGAGQGSLNFESDSGDRSLNQVDGTHLGVMLEGYPSLQLIVLNACKSAQATVKEDQDAFQGVAPALVMSGIPAVVAMQYIISVEAAVAFSSGFYPRLAQTGSLDHAMAEGRKRIYNANPDDIEWATPVLFMRSADGRLFSAAGTGGPGHTGNAESSKGSVTPTLRTQPSPSSSPRIGDTIEAAIQNASRQGLNELLNRLGDLFRAEFPDSRISKAFAAARAQPESKSRLAVLNEYVEDLALHTQPGVVKIAHEMDSVLADTRDKGNNRNINVEGTGNLFSGGDMNIGGDVTMGDKSK